MTAARSVVIDFLPDSVERYRDHAVVVVDVIRASTTLATGVALGRRCFVARDVAGALTLARTLEGALLAGEIGGVTPAGFDMTNSPAALALRTDVERPLVLVSSSGTLLMDRARDGRAAYVACFRNFSAVAAHVADRHPRLAVIGAGTRGEFREEDQMCCAWIAEVLMQRGHAAENTDTAGLVARWSGAAAGACRVSSSVHYLARTDQLADLDFILAKIDDLPDALTFRGSEVVVP